MIRKTLLAAAVAGFALHAQAAAVVVNFSTDVFDGGSLLGLTLTGQLSYDDATLTASTTALAANAFSFTLAGQTYTLSGADLGNASVAFDNGVLLGVDAVAPGAGTHDFSFTSDFGFGAPYVFYTNTDTRVTNDFGFANVSFLPAATVPEPASYALMLVALGGGLLARRLKA